jgi:hypothetical protein
VGVSCGVSESSEQRIGATISIKVRGQFSGQETYGIGSVSLIDRCAANEPSVSLAP